MHIAHARGAVVKRRGALFFNVIYTLRSSLVRPSYHAHVVWLFVLVPVGDCAGRSHGGSSTLGECRRSFVAAIANGSRLFSTWPLLARAATRKHRLSHCDVSRLN